MTVNRTPAGVPTGGQFAAAARSEADVDLDETGDLLTPEARRVVERFERRSLSCTNESKRLVAALRRAGVNAERLSLVGGRYGDHSVVHVDGVVIDHTFDQFETDAPVPVVKTIDEYVADWDDYGTGFYAGTVLNSWKADAALAEPPTFTAEEIEKATDSYVTTLRWSSSLIDDEGESQDADDYEFSDEARAECKGDVEDFLASNAHLIEEAGRIQPGYDVEHAMHDFALTRNGHGAGFWDRGLGEVGDELTAMAKPYGSVDLYVGDDGLLYI